MEDDPDRQYYNITIAREDYNSENLIASFSETRVSPIVNNASDYEMAVIRFDLPAINIPIFIWPTTDIWYMSITYKTSVFTRPVPFIPNQNLATAPKYYGQAIWHYSDYVDCLNLCLQQCFADFQADPVYLTIPVIDRPAEPPRMTYNAETNRVSMYYPLQYDITKPDPIYVYFSHLLFTIFPAFQNFGDRSDLILSHYLIVKDNRNNKVTVNGTQYFRITEEWPELFAWSDFQRIVFETDSVPVQNEFIAGQQNVSRKVLTDFEPAVAVNDQSNIQFFPRGDLRFYDMFSDHELRTIDMKVFWQGKDGRLFPIFISGTDRLTIKLLIKKKGVMVSNICIF